ncbi:MAG: tetratricopeptide repeat protein [Melioribacteraceae bacterium]
MSRFLSLLIILILLFPLITFSQKQSPQNYETTAHEVIRLTFNSQFDEAFKIVDEHLAKEPQALTWKYFHAMILFRQAEYQIYIADSYGRSEYKTQAKELLNSSYVELIELAKIGDKLIEKNPRDTVALFYTGAVYGYIGMYLANQGDNFKAASMGRKGMDYHEQLMKMYPKWNDVYYSEGVFNFYASNVPWWLKPILWILGRSGTESKAEENLKKVADNSNYAKYAAMEYLMQLYLRQKKFDLAIKYCDQLGKEFPNNRYKYKRMISWSIPADENYKRVNEYLRNEIENAKKEELSEINKLEVSHFYLSLANNYSAIGEYSKSIAVFNELIDSKLIPATESWSRVRLAEEYSKLGKRNEALYNINWVLKNSTAESHKTRVKEILAKLNEK